MGCNGEGCTAVALGVTRACAMVDQGGFGSDLTWRWAWAVMRE